MAHNLYDFECPNCGAAGEAGIPADCRTLIEHGCGQLFIQQQPYGMFGKPTLVAVNNTNGGMHQWTMMRKV